ncbi:hypothetical protein ABIC90_005144, partial [Variovorax boronicumulans]
SGRHSGGARPAPHTGRPPKGSEQDIHTATLLKLLTSSTVPR